MMVKFLNSIDFDFIFCFKNLNFDLFLPPTTLTMSVHNDECVLIVWFLVYSFHRSIHPKLLSCGIGAMTSADRQQPHLLSVEVVDRRKSWGKSQQCVKMSVTVTHFIV